MRRIIAAFTINRLGGWFGLVALLVVVYKHTHSALAVSALLLAWQALPAFAVPPLVARVEASVRGHELSGLYFFEAAATAALAVLASHFWLPAVLLLAALDGTAALAAAALLRAELGRAAGAYALTVREKDASPPVAAGGQADQDAAARCGTSADAETDDDRVENFQRSANAALNIGFAATFVVGPALGGIAVATTGAPAALLIDVGSFALGGMLLADLHPHVEEAAGASVRERLQAAWGHINERPALRTLLLVYAIALGLFETAAPIEVSFVEGTLRAGSRGLGLLLTCWGGGAVLGGVVFARVREGPLALMLSMGTLAIGLADAGFALSPTLAVACGAAVLGGLGNGVELPALMSLVQQLAPSHMHGRLMGAVESLTACSIALGLLLGGALVALSSTRFAFGVVALATGAVAAALLRLGRQETNSGSGRPDDDTRAAELAHDKPIAVAGLAMPCSRDSLEDED